MTHFHLRRLLPGIMLGMTATVALLLLLPGAEARSGEIRRGVQVEAAAVQLAAANEFGLSLTLEVPRATVGEDGQVAITGLETESAQPGAPELPTYRTLIALPPQADAAVAVTEGEVVSWQPGVTVRAAAYPITTETTLDENLDGLAATVSNTSREPDAVIYGSDSSYPESAYTLSAPFYYRDLRLAWLELYPVRYNPVRSLLAQSLRMEVTVSFSGGVYEQAEATIIDDPALDAVLPLILNNEQARRWRQFPENMIASGSALPTGVDTFKIAFNETGIYEIGYDDLAAAGMDVDTVNPNTFALLYRGQPVSYEFIGDSNNDFDPGEALRFYGWRFDDSRHDEMYVDHNVFWLWAGGTAARVSATSNPTGNADAVSFRESLTFEPDPIFTHTRTDEWFQFPNEADAWYWDKLDKLANTPPVTVTKAITVPDPAATGANATLTVELLSRHNFWLHEVALSFGNDPATVATKFWSGVKNVNISTTVPVGDLDGGLNDANVILKTNNTGLTWYYLNRITIDYQRLFKAVDDQLIFSDAGEPRTYHVGGFSSGNADAVIAWNIGDRLAPQRVPFTAANISGSGPYTYTFGSDAPDARFIVTNESALLSPDAITRVVHPDLEPAAGGADWVAITHADFMGPVQQLAAHRQDPLYGSLSTHVVDVSDLLELYGYGLPVPQAIQAYLAHALANWDPAPRYVVLVGDASLNPRQRPCVTKPGDTRFDCLLWGDPYEPTYVPTDLRFVDRIVGLIPVDHSLVLLSGDDLVPDMAIGRFPVLTAAEANAIVQKIIAYDQNARTPEPWQQDVLFLADDPDDAGSFCPESMEVGATLPASLNPVYLCLPPNASDDDMIAMRAAVAEQLNPPNGTLLFNYRGHGATNAWAKNLITTTSAIWLNNEPTSILSMDCLDGLFAYPGTEALSETFLQMNGLGTAAHWSSTGLGWDVEHDPLHHGFYDGLFKFGLTTIGDAINYAKLFYSGTAYHYSQLYSFLLQGDPAMHVMRPDLSIGKSTTQVEVDPGDIVDFTLAIGNSGLYPDRATIIDTLPAQLSFLDASASISATITTTGNVVSISLDEALAWGDTATIQLSARVDDAFGGGTLTNAATITTTSLDINSADNEDSASVFVNSFTMYLPGIVTQ
jgi:uncharacterized repeat protein (TIGR01451 family)